jgi:hypothetical protein
LRLPELFFSRFRLSVAAAVAALAACTPHIGDKCQLSTDCSIQGTLLCDTSQPNGYCTSLNCVADHCQDTAACVQLEPALPGCPYNDRGPARTGRSLCMQRCTSNSDCRQSDGYVCADPREAPWNALILDDDQAQHVCILAPNAASFPPDGGADAGPPPVCSASGPFVPPIDASVMLEGFDSGGPDVGVDSGEDAAQDAGAGVDGAPPEAGAPADAADAGG